MSDSPATLSPTIEPARTSAPVPTRAYGGMAPGVAFTGNKPGEVPAPSIMALNVNPQKALAASNAHVTEMLAAPLRKSTGKTWWESTHGRMGTRLFSRGLAGSLAYALASMAVERAMQRYTPHKNIDDAEHYKFANKPWHRFIRGAAMLLDKTVGRVIGGGLIGSAGATRGDWVTFRNTRFFGRTDAAGMEQPGRSLGHEYVDVVFNFAAASIGDSTARNLAGLIDPNKPISWLEGGKWDVKKMMISQGKALWKTISYFAGEDFIVGLPYIYSMKLQREAMNKFSPGFKYAFDYGNSDAYRVDKTGKLTGETYYKENIIDYQLRFSNYNVMTLMFRETYNSIGDRINSWVKDGNTPKFTLPDSPGEALGHVGQFIKDAARYVVHSTIKGYVMMTLTVPFFSFLRVPQAKNGAFGGMAINPQLGPMMIDSSHLPSGSAIRPLTPDFRAKMNESSKLTDGNEFYKIENDRFVPVGVGANAQPMQMHFFEERNDPAARASTAKDLQNPFAKPLDPSRADKPFDSFDPYDHSNQGRAALSPVRLLNNLGKKSNELGAALYDRLSDINYGSRDAANSKDIAEAEKDLKSASVAGVNAIMPYTAYFVVKTELGQRDTPEMDRQIDTLQDGIAELDGRKFVDGLKGIAREFIKPSKNTGAGSVFGRDNADTIGATPWSKRVIGDIVDPAQMNHVAARTSVPLASRTLASPAQVAAPKPKATQESWRDRNAAAPSEINSSPSIS